MKGGMDRRKDGGMESEGSPQRFSHWETEVNSRTQIGFFFPQELYSMSTSQPQNWELIITGHREAQWRY